jgi:hypothetical protein
MEKSVDRFGWEYYPGLPQDFIPARLEDFHINRKLKLGMEYVIKWDDRQYYEIRVVNSELSGKWLLPFIEFGRVFIRKLN